VFVNLVTPELCEYRVQTILGVFEQKERGKTAGNKKKLNQMSQSADKDKNGRFLYEYSLFGLARHHYRIGLP